MVDLLVKTLVAAAALHELCTIDDTAQVQPNVDAISELLKHKNFVEQVARKSHYRPNHEGVLLSHFGLVVSCCLILLLQNLEPMVVDLLEDRELILYEDWLVLLLSRKHLLRVDTILKHLWAEEQESLGVDKELQRGNGVLEDLSGLVEALDNAEAQGPIAQELISCDAVDALPYPLLAQGLRMLLRLIDVPVAQHVHHLLELLRPLLLT